MRIFAAILLTAVLAIPSLLAAQTPTFRGRTVAQWSDDLSHPNSVVRTEAGKMLGRLGKHAAAAVDPLISALRDRNPDVRLHAASAIGRINHRPQTCLAALTKVLADQDEHVRFAAEWSVARIALDVATVPHTKQEADTLDALLAAAESSLAKSVRNSKHLQQILDARKALQNPAGRVAATATGTAPPDGQSIKDESTALLVALQSDDKLVQLKAIEKLSQLGRTKELVGVWRTADEGSFLHWHLTQALIKIGQPVVPLWAEVLHDRDEMAAQRAADSLRQMGPAAIRALPQVLTLVEDQNASEDLRESAIWIVERFGPAAENAVGTLTGILKTQDADRLIESSARALGAIGPAATSAEATLIEILQDEDRPAQTRVAAAESLPAISPNSTAAAASLVALLDRHEDPYLASALAGPIGQYRATKAVPRLLELVDTTVDYERQQIIRALGNIGPEARQATSRLIECLVDVDEFDSVQVAASRSLGALGPDAVAALAGNLENPDDHVRQTIVRALIEIGTGAATAVEPLELRLNDRNESTEVQALAAVALGQIGPAAKSTIPTLTRLMGDVRQAVYLRSMAAVSIGQIDPQQTPTLIAALNDSDPQIRVAAAYSLQRLPAPHPDALPTLIRELDDDAARGMAMRALSEFKGDSRPLLSHVVKDQSRDEQTRVACLNLISENGIDATEQLLDALNDRALAEAAYWSLRDLGNESIPYLVAAADDAEHTEEAQGAIRELVEELFGGIGGGDGDDAWSNGHALVDRPGDHDKPAARHADVAAETAPSLDEPDVAEGVEPGEPEAMLLPEPEPSSTAEPAESVNPPAPAIAATRVASEDGVKSVKVFYGTNRQQLENGNAKNGAHLPWYVWLLIALTVGGLIVYVVKQVRRRDTGRTIVGIAGIILFALAVEIAVTRIQKLDQALAKSGPAYGTEYSTQVEMGVCNVTIPAVHQEGQIERPSVIRLQVVEDPEKHIILKNVQQLEPAAFFTDLRSELGERGNSILVFVHGYNVSFASAARRTAQMSDDLKFAGAPIFYSWPSQANWRKYREDEKNVELSINQLKTFLLDITRRSGADTINLIAHSMGNRALTHALKEIEVTSSRQDKLFNQVILAAPDIDADIFRQRIAPAIVTKARHITLYASSKDLALVASRKFNSGDRRAGDAGADLVVVPGIETIDVSAGESSLLGHSYYGDSTSVLHDIEFLLRDHPAAERQFLEPFPRLEPTHWLFQPAAMARRGEADAWH